MWQQYLSVRKQAELRPKVHLLAANADTGDAIVWQPPVTLMRGGVAARPRMSRGRPVISRDRAGRGAVRACFVRVCMEELQACGEDLPVAYAAIARRVCHSSLEDTAGVAGGGGALSAHARGSSTTGDGAPREGRTYMLQASFIEQAQACLVSSGTRWSDKQVRET